jgi:hypothetical protein
MADAPGVGTPVIDAPISHAPEEAFTMVVQAAVGRLALVTSSRRPSAGFVGGRR